MSLPGISGPHMPGGIPMQPKRRLSDASTDSTTAKKLKKSGSGSFISNSSIENITGSKDKDGSNKTKSGRFKPGAPIDLDEQCGVLNDKNQICSRSLKCKTHGVGAKRSVSGRSKPFDILLAEFQARKDAAAKIKEDRAAMGGSAGGAVGTSASGTHGTSGPSASSGQSKPSANTAAGQSSGQAGVQKQKSNAHGSTATAGTSSKQTSGSGATASGAAPVKKNRKSDGKSKRSSTKNKADLILGEVDDPPENIPLTNKDLDSLTIIEMEEAPDSDDETEQLLQAITNSKPKSVLETSADYAHLGPIFPRSAAKVKQYRDTFLTAFTGRTMSSVTS